MPITVTKTLYLLAELPTEKAKARAREWWRACEESNPSGVVEYRKTIVAAVKAVYDETIFDMDPDNCPLTGYYMDHAAVVAAQLYKKETSADDYDPNMCKRLVRAACAAVFQAEVDANLEDKNADDMCAVNEYYFDEQGNKGNLS